MPKTRWDELVLHRPLRKSNLAQRMADHLRRRIVTGDLPAHRRLPSVGRLAVLYGVSPSTAHAAVQILAGIGLVRTHQGVGSFVRHGAAPITASVNGWLLATTEELVAAREHLDRTMAITAATQVAKLAELRTPRIAADLPFLALERWAATSRSADSFVEADAAFHVAVASVHRTRQLAANVRELIAIRLHRVDVGAADLAAEDAILDQWHRRLASAIVEGRPGPAGRIGARIAAAERHLLDGE